jgi:hypothetical protein
MRSIEPEISRFSGAQLRTVVGLFEASRNDGGRNGNTARQSTPRPISSMVRLPHDPRAEPSCLPILANSTETNPTGALMRSHPFGPTGINVSVIGQGTWYLDRGDRKAAIAALRRGIELGMTHIDTAEMYGDAELVIA